MTTTPTPLHPVATTQAGELPEWSTLKCADALRALASFGPTVRAQEMMLKGYIDGKCYYDVGDLRELAAACIEAADWLEKRAAIETAQENAK